MGSAVLGRYVPALERLAGCAGFRSAGHGRPLAAGAVPQVVGNWPVLSHPHQDLTRVMNRLKAMYRSWAIPCAGEKVYSPRHRSAWLEQLSEAGMRRRAEQLYQQLDVLRPRCLLGSPQGTFSVSE